MLDLAYVEWQAKPVAFVSYGGVSGGLRAVEHLRQVFAELHSVSIRDGVSATGAEVAINPRDIFWVARRAISATQTGICERSAGTRTCFRRIEPTFSGPWPLLGSGARHGDVMQPMARCSATLLDTLVVVIGRTVNLETITEAAHRMDGGRRPSAFQLSAQISHVDFDDVGVRVKFVLPYAA